MEQFRITPEAALILRKMLSKASEHDPGLTISYFDEPTSAGGLIIPEGTFLVGIWSFVSQQVSLKNVFDGVPFFIESQVRRRLYGHTMIAANGYVKIVPNGSLEPPVPSTQKTPTLDALNTSIATGKSAECTTDNSTKIDFGVVSKYFPDKGFGFITHTFSDNHQKEVFFHIKTVKVTRPDLALKLAKGNALENIWFWYEIEASKKGEQVRSIVDPKVIPKELKELLPLFTDKVENIWKNIRLKLPEWIDQVTMDLVGPNRASELRAERDLLEKLIREENERKRIFSEYLQIKESAKIEKANRKIKAQQETEEKEFQQLVAEMIPLGLTNSSQVSSYIVSNRLGYKYENISGIVKMEQDGTIWEFKGGFPPNIYARLCAELGLRNNGTPARPVGFESFKDLQGNRQR